MHFPVTTPFAIGVLQGFLRVLDEYWLDVQMRRAARERR